MVLADRFDEAIDSPITRGEPYLEKAFRYLKQRVGDAHRYSIEREAAMMVMNFTHGKLSNLTKALHLCRLPAPVVWIEFPFSARTDWLTEAVKHGHQINTAIDANAPARMGFLLEEIQHDENRFILGHPTWVHDAHMTPNGLPPIMQISRKGVLIDVSPVAVRKLQSVERLRASGRIPDEVRAHVRGDSRAEFEAWCEIENRISNYVPPIMEDYWKVARSYGPEVFKQTEQAADYDLAQEWRFILGYLILANSRNIMRTDAAEDLTRLNRSRAKKGKPPLLTYRPIRLSLSKVQKNRIAHGYAGPRAQQSGEPFFVDGHFKTRKTGVFWWGLHERNARDGKAAVAKPHQVVA